MRYLVIGAGASLAEAYALGIPDEQCPPLIRNFARKTWANYTPYPVLEAYLRDIGYDDLGEDPRELFYILEESGVTNVERFMEFVWIHRKDKWKLDVEDRKVPPGYIVGGRLLEAGSHYPASSCEFWENFLYHGIGAPLQYCMTFFFENGKGWKDLKLSKTVASHLDPCDLVVNLNYDTVFELALQQSGLDFAYSPNLPSSTQILICKPHGSLNMVMNDQAFTFGQPEWLGMPQPPGYRSYSGLIPPRLNKDYSQHPVAAMILAPARDRKPQIITMWGIGLADSDVDLLSLYKDWAKTTDCIEIINPSREVAAQASALFGGRTKHFASLSEWHQSVSQDDA